MLTAVAFSSSIFALSLVTTPLPDAVDHLRSGDIKPNVGLLLDSSCSMAYNPKIQTSCSWWAGRYNNGNMSFTKNQVMRSVLTGCQSADDGILDKWSERVNFSVFHFGRSVGQKAPFESTASTLESAVMSIPNTGGTPMSIGIHDHARYFQTYFNDGNTKTCRPNFLLMLSDGDPNGGSKTYQFNCPVTGDGLEKRYVAARRPWDGAGYVHEHQDMLCNVVGEQNISTFTIGFGAPGSFSPSNLQNIANRGGGEYFYASDMAGLDTAFQQIISRMASRTALFYSAPAVQLDGLFADNIVYTSAFKPEKQGRWSGTVKKYCIEPRKKIDGSYDTADTACLFKSARDGETLLTNPGVVDLWTGSSTTSATHGGAGLVLTAKVGAPGGAPKGKRPRNILTWRPGTRSYVAVQPESWKAADSWTSAADHAALLNGLHGYTFDADASGDPVAVSTWPLGDPIHSPTALLRYGDDCSQRGQCFVAVGMNDGMLHFFDAADGEETTALIPADLWRPGGVSTSQLRDIELQPNEDFTHRYFVDGGLVLFHVDDSGDGVINSGEKAALIFGLGRGGAAYYMIPVGSFNGKLDASANPIHPLTWSDSAFRDLEQTYATPWAGQTKLGGAIKNVAVFGSGHVPEYDNPSAMLPSPVRAREGSAVGAATATLHCNDVATGVGLSSSYCRMWKTSGYTDTAPMDVTRGPFWVKDAFAYRVKFNKLEMEAADRVELRDSQGNVIQEIKSTGWSNWVYDDKFEIRITTNGVQTSDRGFKMGNIEHQLAAGSGTRVHSPSVFLLDIDGWNGSTPVPFAAKPTNGGVLMQISKTCTESPGICVSAGGNPDLNDMTCPISSEVAAYTVGGMMSALYWGDECGQLWKAYRTDESGKAWKARRLISLSNTNGKLSSGSTPAGRSGDFRKIFRRVDLVSSSCPGKRVVGVYFGTGNAQRPAATDSLTDSALTNGRDIAGVVWDFSGLPANLSLKDLEDATSNPKIDPKQVAINGKHGWFFGLGANERILRDPLVFEGVAYYKSFQPATQAAECGAGTGIDRIYAVNNCTAEAFVDKNGDGKKSTGDRVAWDGNQDVGGNLLIVTPQNAPPIISHANLAKEEKAKLANYDRGRVPSIFNWREPKYK